MTTIMKVHRKGQMTLPTKLRDLAGIAEGDLLQATFQRGKIIITPTLVIDRSKFPTADDDYTPAQRRIIDARLDKAEKGLRHGPFTSAGEAVAHMKEQLKKRAAGEKLKPAR